MKLKLPSLLLLTVSSLNGFSQWNIDPAINTTVSSVINDQQDVRIVSDSKQGAIISWVDFRNDPSAGDIYVQRMNYAGVPKWTTDGVAICTDAANQAAVAIVDAGNGSAIMTWQDWRNGDRDIYAQKVDSLGNVLWTANGAAVCIKANHQQGPKLISDDNGGAIIVWEDSIGGSWDIYAQHLNSSGVATWTSNGVVVCNAADSQINPKIKTDGAGGAIIIWQDKRNGIEYHIYGQRISSTGVMAWAANGVSICNTPGGQTNPKIEIDGVGGGYVGWQDKRNGINYDIYVERIDGSGTSLWTANGVMVCNAVGSQSAVDMTTDMVTGVIISWKDDRSGLYQIYTNKLSPAGVVEWMPNGIQIAPGINPNIIGDANGGAIVCWQDSTTAGGTWNVYAERLNDTGAKQWGSSGVAVATANGGQSSPKNVADGNGGSIYAWQDKRNTSDLDIYAHKLTSGGYSASVAELHPVNYSFCFPNPFNTSTSIKMNFPSGPESWTLNVFDATGKRIFCKTEEHSDAMIFNRNGLAEGIYFYQVTTRTGIMGSGNFIITE